MRRADRLFEIIQYLRSRQLTTAKWLAEKLEVCERTVYRDIQHLIATGVPIDSEAGVGYVLRKEYDLPPLMFDFDEIISLVIGSKMATSLGGEIKHHAERALSKLNSTLPSKQQQQLGNIKVYSPMIKNPDLGNMISKINYAIIHRYILMIEYQKLNQEEKQIRSICPLGIFFWHEKWTLVAWCLLRNDFRHFRIDRILSYHLTDEHFTLRKEQQLTHYFSLVNADPKHFT